jgi:protein Mpv17
MTVSKLSATVLMAAMVLVATASSCCQAFHVAPAAAGAWAWYKSMLVVQPLLTKSVTSSCIMSISDIMCQELVASRTEATESKQKTVSSTSMPKLDSTRILQVAITGFVWSGPITHVWYAMLERIYAVLSRLLHIQNAGLGLVIKLFLDAMLFSPTVVAGYFCVRSVLEGHGLDGAREKLRAKFKPTLVGAWKFWPLVNSINFWFVPLQFRVLYMNVLSLLWSGYLTYVNSSKTPASPKDKRGR